MQLTNFSFIIMNTFSYGTKRIAILVATVALTDFLVFKQHFGLNLFLLSLSFTAAVLLAARKAPRPSTAAIYIGLSALASAPLQEAPTVTGFLLSVTALILIALKSANLLPGTPSAISFVFLRFMPSILTGLPKACRRYSYTHCGRNAFGTALKSLAGWMLPLGMSLVFLFLFSAANPLITMGLYSIDLQFMMRLLDVSRLGFWLVATAFIWGDASAPDPQTPAFLDERHNGSCGARSPRLHGAVPLPGNIQSALGDANCPRPAVLVGRRGFAGGNEPCRLCPSWRLSTGCNGIACGGIRAHCHAPRRARRQEQAYSDPCYHLDRAKCPSLPVVHSRAGSLRGNLFADMSATCRGHMDGSGRNRPDIHSAADHVTAYQSMADFDEPRRLGDRSLHRSILRFCRFHRTVQCSKQSGDCKTGGRHWISNISPSSAIRPSISFYPAHPMIATNGALRVS